LVSLPQLSAAAYLGRHTEVIQTSCYCLWQWAEPNRRTEKRDRGGGDLSTLLIWVVGHTKVVQAKRDAYGSVSDLRSWKMVKSELSSDLTIQCSAADRGAIARGSLLADDARSLQLIP